MVRNEVSTPKRESSSQFRLISIFDIPVIYSGVARGNDSKWIKRQSVNPETLHLSDPYDVPSHLTLPSSPCCTLPDYSCNIHSLRMF